VQQGYPLDAMETLDAARAARSIATCRVARCGRAVTTPSSSRRRWSGPLTRRRASRTRRRPLPLGFEHEAADGSRSPSRFRPLAQAEADHPKRRLAVAARNCAPADRAIAVSTSRPSCGYSRKTRWLALEWRKCWLASGTSRGKADFCWRWRGQQRPDASSPALPDLSGGRKCRGKRASAGALSGADFATEVRAG